MTLYKVKKYSTYTGKAISITETFQTKEKAIDFIKSNTSYTGAYTWKLTTKTI